ncbi:hypothetical protein SLA2020_282600 [Shorea laevis]
MTPHQIHPKSTKCSKIENTLSKLSPLSVVRCRRKLLCQAAGSGRCHWPDLGRPAVAAWSGGSATRRLPASEFRRRRHTVERWG